MYLVQTEADKENQRRWKEGKKLNSVEIDEELEKLKEEVRKAKEKKK